MKGKIKTILLITVLLISTITLAIPVNASPDVEIVETGDFYEWSTDEQVGVYSIHVTFPKDVSVTGLDIIASPTAPILLSDITEIKFWEKVVVPGGDVDYTDPPPGDIEIATGITLYLDMNDDGVFDWDHDAQIVLECPKNDPLVLLNLDTWDERDAFTDGYTGFDKGGGQLDLPSGDITYWKTTAYSTYDVISVGLVLGWGNYGYYDGYLDDITVNGVTYLIEKTGTLSISTTPVYGEVFVNGVSWGSTPESRVLAAGDYVVSYGAYAGYTKPSPVLATVTEDTTTTITGIYKLITTGSGFSSDRIDITNDNKPALGDAGEKGHTIILEGYPDSVASGYEVSVYWGKIQDWDGAKGHLNTTEADKDGSFEIWFNVPESPVGTNYLWFTATDQETKISKEFTVISDCDISTSSGLQGSKVYVDLWGFAKNKEVAILFVKEDVTGYPDTDWNKDLFKVTSENLAEIVDPDEDDYDGTLANDMIEPGTFVLHIGDYTFDDNSKGSIYSVYGESCGSINYVTGEWSIDIGDTAATETGAFSAEYEYFGDIPNHCYVITSTGVTNDLGSWEDKRMTIPDVTVLGKYYVVGFDGKNNKADAGFTIGATITLSTDEGDVGDKIEVNGEGFKAGTEITASLYKGTSLVSACHIVGSAGTGPVTGTDKVDSDGEFEFYIIIPSASKKDDDYEIRITDDGTNTATSDFEVTGLADVSVDPAFGPQGSSLTVSGKNFQNIKDKKSKDNTSV